MTTNSHIDIHQHLPSREAVMSSIADNRGWFIAMGTLLLIAGGAALAFPLASSIAVELIVGTVFAAAGLIYIAHAFGAPGWGGFAWEIFVGLVYLIAGIFLMVRPVEGTAVLTLVVAFTFVADGIARTIFSAMMRRGPWGWMLASGLLSLALGIAALAMFPVTAVWLLGVMVGINLVASGSAFTILAVSAPDAEPKDTASTA